MKQELFYKLKQNSLDEFMYIAQHKPNALQILQLVIKRTNRETGKAFIGYTDFKMTQQEYRSAKQYLEKTGNCKFTGTKEGTIAEISDKIFDLNINRDNNRDTTEQTTEIKNLKDSVIIEDIQLEENKNNREKTKKQQSKQQLTKNYKNKNYNNINNYNYNTKYIGSNLKKIFPNYNKVLTNF